MERKYDKIVWVGLDNFISEYVTALAAALSRHTAIPVQVVQSRKISLQFNNPDSQTTLYIFSLGTKIREISRFPPLYIIHQTEQYSQPVLALANSNYHTILKSAFWIWDYSLTNINYIKRHNQIEHISYLPFSYLPELEYPTISDQCQLKYQVLFIGTLSRRRIEILNRFAVGGLRVKTSDSVFGEEKRKLISESAIVLNIHFDKPDRAILETERIGYLLANRCCIVSEFSSERSTTDNYYSNAVVFASDLEDLLVQCQHLLSVPGLLEFWKENSYQWFKDNCSQPPDFSCIE